MSMRQPLMKMTVELPTMQITKLRDGTPLLAPRLSARFEPRTPSADWPVVEVDVEIHAGRPVVTRVALIGSPARPIRSNAVRNHSLEKLTALALRDIALNVEPDGTTYVPDLSAETFERVVTAARQRTSVGRDRLAEVARHYKAGGVKAVERNLVISRSQAYRLIAHARNEGTIK